MSEKSLAGRKALVTGGARGIGAAIAEALTKAGASVMIGDILADLGKETAGRLAKSGAKTGFVELNVTDDAQWERAVAATIATLGGYDILINNAGIEITSLVVDLKAEDLRRMCDVNIVGTGLGMKHAFRAMRPGGGAGAGGAIVNIASVAATIAFPAIAGYSGTKSAVDRMTRVAAMEAGKLGYGVRVNCLYPGLVPTDMGMQLANDIVAAGLRTGRRRRRHLGRRADAAWAVGRGRRHGRRRCLPLLQRGALHHWCRPAGRRRHGHVSRQTQRTEIREDMNMSEKKPVVVYGVSGYTGRLVCEYLREYNIPFIAAGRDAAKVKAVVEKIPGIETADYEVAEVEHTVEALTKLFRGVQVVSNMVGPFIKYGPEVVEACLAAGCHYTDTTGEQDWVLLTQERWGTKFAAKGLLLAPNVAHMYTTGEIAANICLETPGLDTLDILVLWKGFPTYASTQTIFTILKANWYYLVQNKFVEWDVTANFEVNVPGQHEGAIAVPWGGTAHPVWFKNDPRVSNCRVLGGVMQRDVMLGVVQTQEMVKEKIKPLPPDQQEKALADIAATLQATMPPRENPRINTSIDSVYASGPLGRAHCVIHGNCNYKQTGMLQAYAAFSLLQTAPRKVGFASACQAFGHRELLGQLRSFGLVMNPILTVHN